MRVPSIILLTAWALLAPAFFGGGAAAQTTGVVRFGRVITAASVRGWGDYVVRDQFTPGERVWLYAETLGTVRNGRVDLMFRFMVIADDGRAVHDSTAEYTESSSSSNWGAWRSFVLPRLPAPPRRMPH